MDEKQKFINDTLKEKLQALPAHSSKSDKVGGSNDARFSNVSETDITNSNEPVPSICSMMKSP